MDYTVRYGLEWYSALPAVRRPPFPQGIRRSRSSIGKTACWN